MIDTMNIKFCFKATKYNAPDLQVWSELNLGWDNKEFLNKCQDFMESLYGLPFSKQAIAIQINDFFKIEPNIIRKFGDEGIDVFDVLQLETELDVINIGLSLDYMPKRYECWNIEKRELLLSISF